MSQLSVKTAASPSQAAPAAKPAIAAPKPELAAPAPAAQDQSRSADLARDAAARAIASRVRLLDRCFASTDPQRHLDGAALLRGVPDEVLTETQLLWAKTHGGAHLYSTLFEMATKGVTPGVAEALVLLRRAFARNAPMQKLLMQAFTSKRVIETSAWQVRHNLRVSEFEDQGLDALRNHPMAVMEAIKAKFKAATGFEMIDWMIDHLPRTAATVTAMALVRGADEHAPHVDLGAMLIAEDNTNTDLPLERLRAPWSARKTLEANFNRTFENVGPRMGQKQPYTLNAYLNLKLGHTGSSVKAWAYEKASFHEAIMLLRHDKITDAERLYLALTQFVRTKNEAAVAVLRDLTARGVGRMALEADWEANVRRDPKGTSWSFTDESLSDHVHRVLVIVGNRYTQAGAHIVSLLNALPANSLDPVAEPAADAGMSTKDYWAARLRREESLFALDERMLASANTTIAAVQRRVSPDDKQILEALRTIVSIHDRRIDRLRTALRDSYREPHRDLEAQTRFELALNGARAARDQARIALTEKVDARHTIVTLWAEPLQTARDLFKEDIKLSPEKKLEARLILGQTPTVADQVYVAVVDHEYDTLLTLVNKTWAEGGIDAMLDAASRPALDAKGREARPAFHLATRLAGKRDLSVRRALTLAHANRSDALRGVNRIDLEMSESTSAVDLAQITGLFTQPGMTPKLRDAVIKTFGDVSVRGFSVPKDLAPTPEARFLAAMRAHFEGETENYFKLEEAIAPPKTPRERALLKRRREALGSRGLVAGVKVAVARTADNIWGDRSREAMDRSGAAVENAAVASGEQLEPLAAETGVEGRDALSAKEFANFKSRQANVLAMELACAQMIGSLLEAVVEAGLAMGSGGVGWLAVRAALAASAVNILSQELLLGPEFKLIAQENFNKVIMDGLTSAMVELKLRDAVIAKMPLKKLGESLPGVQQAIQNVATGGIERIVLSGTEIISNGVVRGKIPSDDEIARHAATMLSTLIGKVGTTGGAFYYNPAKNIPYATTIQGVKNALIFKYSLKLPIALTGEIANILLAHTPDQTLADEFMQVMRKQGKGLITTGIKALGSQGASLGNDHNEKVRITAAYLERPEQFALVLKQAYVARYAKYPELKAEHEAMQAAGAPISIVDYMGWKIQQPEKKSGDRAKDELSIAELTSKLHDDVLAHTDFLTPEPTRLGASGFRGKPKTLAQIAAETRDPAVVITPPAAPNPAKTPDKGKDKGQDMAKEPAAPSGPVAEAKAAEKPAAPEPAPPPKAPVKSRVITALTGPIGRATPKAFATEAEFHAALDAAGRSNLTGARLYADLLRRGVDMSTLEANYHYVLGKVRTDPYGPSARFQLWQMRNLLARIAKGDTAVEEAPVSGTPVSGTPVSGTPVSEPPVSEARAKAYAAGVDRAKSLLNPDDKAPSALVAAPVTEGRVGVAVPPTFKTAARPTRDGAAPANPAHDREDAYLDHLVLRAQAPTRGPALEAEMAAEGLDRAMLRQTHQALLISAYLQPDNPLVAQRRRAVATLLEHLPDRPEVVLRPRPTPPGRGVPPVADPPKGFKTHAEYMGFVGDSLGRAVSGLALGDRLAARGVTMASLAETARSLLAIGQFRDLTDQEIAQVELLRRAAVRLTDGTKDLRSP